MEGFGLSDKKGILNLALAELSQIGLRCYTRRGKYEFS